MTISKQAMLATLQNCYKDYKNKEIEKRLHEIDNKPSILIIFKEEKVLLIKI